MGIYIDNVDLQRFIVRLKNIQKLRYTNYGELNGFIAQHSGIKSWYIYNDTIYDINNKFGNNSYWDGVMNITNVAKKYEICPILEKKVHFITIFDL